MRIWALQLDQLLRGEKTNPQKLRSSKLSINTVGIAIIVGLLAVSYGLCIGSFALARGFETGESDSIRQGIMQATANMIKMPLLYLTTLCITFPSLYVFSALSGSRLRVGEVMKLLVASLAINLAVLASLGPIVAFFSVSTPSYHFVLLLNVLCCAIAGLLGMAFLLQTLYRMTDPNFEKEPILQQTPSFELDPLEQQNERESGTIPDPSNRSDDRTTGPLEKTAEHVLGPHVRKVFLIWVVVFGLVGSQMGWVLRPFIGSPNKPFTWFRQRDSNVFEGIWVAFQGLFG